jgi:hypothetical protein
MQPLAFRAANCAALAFLRLLRSLSAADAER